MKKILFIVFLFFSVSFRAQEKSLKNNHEEDYNIFISGGCHLGIWAAILSQKITLKQIPYNIHIDKLFKQKQVLGLGYTYDAYPVTTYPGHRSTENNYRHNFRVRYYKYLRDQNRIFSTYIGASVGVSYWDMRGGGYSLRAYFNYWPTAQFISGIKIKFAQFFFWQTEMAIGPPYILQSSIGIKF